MIQQKHTPVEVNNFNDWMTIQLNENDLKILEGRHPIYFNKEEKEFMIIRIQ